VAQYVHANLWVLDHLFRWIAISDRALTGLVTCGTFKFETIILSYQSLTVFFDRMNDSVTSERGIAVDNVWHLALDFLAIALRGEF
jgi:hypothetical protein